MPATRSQLGQYFTPRAVVDFALEALAALDADLGGARVCDPACGPGEWLSAALRAGAREAVGIDCDPRMIDAWGAAHLASDPGCLLMVANALDPGLRLDGSFDLVLGNPPFGGDLGQMGDCTPRSLAAHYELPWLNNPPRAPEALSERELARLRRFPTELLFLERFVQLCRRGGWIAIILPEGILANARWRSVRRWLFDRLTFHAVVALPRGAFKASSTTARTCLLLLRAQPAPTDHHTVLATVDQCSPEALSPLLEAIAAAPEACPPGNVSLSEPDLTPPIFVD